MDEQEQLNRSELQQALVSVATRLDLDAKERKEALRKELHAYGALNPEPDLASHAQALSHLLANESLDDWFRTAGGLKVGSPSTLCLVLLLLSDDLTSWTHRWS